MAECTDRAHEAEDPRAERRMKILEDLATLSGEDLDAIADEVESLAARLREVSRTTCACSKRFRLETQHHDWLLSLEDRGFKGAVELLDYIAYEAEDDEEPARGHLMWVDVTDFVACHNWHAPEAVLRLAEHARDSERFRHDANDWGSQLKMIQAAVAATEVRRPHAG